MNQSIYEQQISAFDSFVRIVLDSTSKPLPRIVSNGNERPRKGCIGTIGDFEVHVERKHRSVTTDTYEVKLDNKWRFSDPFDKWEHNHVVKHLTIKSRRDSSLICDIAKAVQA